MLMTGFHSANKFREWEKVYRDTVASLEEQLGQHRHKHEQFLQERAELMRLVEDLNTEVNGLFIITIANIPELGLSHENT